MISEIETGAVRVNLFVIYNDIKNQEWWKDKKQKAAGSYLIHEGESVRTETLTQFGVDPLEMKVIDARPVVIGPSERPFITNKTESLQVVRLEAGLWTIPEAIDKQSALDLLNLNIRIWWTNRSASSTSG